ncbi:MAG: type-F conjugative transfer system protein TraW [Gammaproteobacteria bacterium]
MLIIVIFTNCYASNLGIFGQVYSISEEDFLSFIQKRILEMQKNGELNKIQNQFRQNVERHADRPMPVNSVSVATENKTWRYDPSITIPYDLRDAEGRVIAPAGTTVNPLKYINLHHLLIFFDGDDSKQIEIVKKAEILFKGKTKLILTNGSVINTEKQFNKPIYFDQEGKLINKFNIQHVPAIVEQDGSVLKISEVKP